jgi:predicted nucleic acid-binding protein
VKLFIDASVALAAAGQKTGASHAIFEAAPAMGWELQASNYVLREIAANLHRFPALAAQEWPVLAQRLLIVRDLTSFDYPAVFSPGKDRPVLFTAAGWADVLLTLDRQHFGRFFRSGFYSLRVAPPGDFLAAERKAGRFTVF